MAGPIVTKLPLSNVQDHTQVMDEFGNIYEFDAGERTWIFKGIVQDAAIVNTTTAGLITPKILEKLKLLEKLRGQGINFKLFKLATNADTPYFYFFYSSDDLIRFYPEGQSRLRLEIDRAKLLSKFLSQCCVGPKGQKGLTGDSGKDGLPAPAEAFQDPISTDGGEFVVSAKVPTPIDQPISLRIYSGTSVLAEVLIPLEAIYGDMIWGKIPYAYSSEITVTIADSSVDIDVANILVSYNVGTQVLDATIPFILGAERISTWQFKARQRGAKGDAGSDGRDFFEVVEQFFDDPLLRSDQAIVSLRKPSTSNNLLFIKKAVFDEVCSTNLVPVGGLYPKNKPETVNFLAVRTTPRPCKDIGSFKFVAPEYKVPVLEFPAWTPSPDCCDSSMYNVRRFNWYDRTDPSYIFKIAEDPRPPEQCCQEEFFWCPNVGDNDCGISGSLTPPHRSKPKPPKANCKCDAPADVKIKLQGADGYKFKPLECDNSGQSTPPVSSNVGGTVDHFSIKCKVKGKWKFTWFVDWDDKLCDPKAGTPKAQCDVASNGIGQGNQISKDNFPAQYEFVGDTGADCNIENKEFFLTVNTEKKDCCRAYKVQASVECTCEPSKPSSSSSSSSTSSESDSSNPVITPTPTSSSSESSESDSESTDAFVVQIQQNLSSASSESDSSASSADESASSASSESDSSASTQSASSASSESSDSSASTQSASSASSASSGSSSSSSQTNESNSSQSSASTASTATSATSDSSSSSSSPSSATSGSSDSSPSSLSSDSSPSSDSSSSSPSSPSSNSSSSSAQSSISESLSSNSSSSVLG